MNPVNKCHRCGATSYKPVIKRDESGTMTHSGELQCVGCKLVFTDLDGWRLGPGAEPQANDAHNSQPWDESKDPMQ